MSSTITIDETPVLVTLGPIEVAIAVSSVEPVVSIENDGPEITLNTTEATLTIGEMVVGTVISAAEIQIVTVAEQGPQGIPAQGTGPSYTHTQASAAAAWVVAHNLGRKPFVDVQSSDQQVTARVTHPNATSALVEFNSAQTGTALCF